MDKEKYTIVILFLLLFIPLYPVFAQTVDDDLITPLDDSLAGLIPTNDTIGPVGTVFDITTLESYKLDPEITVEMLEVLPGEQPLTVEFGMAYDELNLIGFGYEDHIREEYVEFLEDLPITVFGKHRDVLNVGIDPTSQLNIRDIENKFKIMYPNVKINVEYASVEYVDELTQYVDTFTSTSTVNREIPNGGGNSISNTIGMTNHAILDSMTVSITVNHEDHDEMYMKLTSPEGREITIFSRERGHADGVQTFTYSSTTNSNLARLAGTDIFGTWTLNIRDAYTGSDTGTLNSSDLSYIT